MIGTVGLDDGEIGHDVLGVGRVGLRALAEEADLALCIRGLELDPGVGPCGVERPVVKPGQVAVLFLAAVAAVREVSSGDVGPIASKTAAIRAVEAAGLKQVIQKPKPLADAWRGPRPAGVDSSRPSAMAMAPLGPAHRAAAQA